MLRIAITQRVIENKEYIEYRDALSHDWLLFLSEILPECAIIPVPNIVSNINDWCNNLSINGIILSNGNDWGSAEVRDITEKKLVKYALEHDIPTLGVCRGFQVLNIIFGGELEENLKKHTTQKHVCTDHELSIVNKKFLSHIGLDAIKTNSFHNQGVLLDGMASCLQAFAVAPDNVVEGFFHPEHNILGLQWHPERRSPNEKLDKQLIQQLFLEGRFW